MTPMTDEQKRIAIVPMRQAVFGAENGNCFPTCIAMITGIPLEEIPNFCQGGRNPQWWPETLAWLESKGWAAVLIYLEAMHTNKACAYSVRKMGIPMIASGKSPRFDCDHCVVVVGDRQYDPHPDDLGIGEDWKDVIILIRADAFLAAIGKGI